MKQKAEANDAADKTVVHEGMFLSLTGLVSHL